MQRGSEPAIDNHGGDLHRVCVPKRNSLRLILFGAGVILAIVGNIGRSLYLSLMAHWRGMDAIEKVHDAAGWSVLAFTAAGVVLLSWMISRAEKAVQTAAAAQAQTDDD